MGCASNSPRWDSIRPPSLGREWAWKGLAWTHCINLGKGLWPPRVGS